MEQEVTGSVSEATTARRAARSLPGHRRASALVSKLGARLYTRLTVGNTLPLDGGGAKVSTSGIPGPGETVGGRYVVERLVGKGGMGAVLAAADSESGGQVAVKVMVGEAVTNSDSSKRFLRELRAVWALDHPHVVKLLDYGTLADGAPYMVLELLDGRSLDQLITDHGPLPIDESVDYLIQACEGVAAAHALGIVHRDLKPGNLFRIAGSDGRPHVKVLDFGISKANRDLDPHTDAESLTETNMLLGSPQYMSPEQVRSSKDVDARTDIWALGVVLYRLLTGRRPFEAKSVGEQFAMVINAQPHPLQTWRSDVPLDLERVILTCLAKSRVKRWQDVGQLAMALAPFGPAGSAERAIRCAAVLEHAGVASASFPGVLEPGDDETTSVDPRRSGAELASHLDGDSTRLAGSSLSVKTAAPVILPQRRRSWPWLAPTLVTLVTLVIALVAGSYLLSSSSTEVTEGDTVAASGPTAPESGAVAVEAPASSVEIRIRTTPTDAAILVDGQPVPSDEPLTLAKGSASHQLIVRAPGHLPEERSFDALVDRDMEIVLEPEPPEEEAAPQRRTVAQPRKPATAAPPTATVPPAATTAAPSATPTATEPPVDVDGPLTDKL